MKIYISYFYQVRNMNAFILPVSTAKYDPFWFHPDVKNPKTGWHSISSYGMYLDKNRVLNGRRIDELVFPEGSWKRLEQNNCACTQVCFRKDGITDDTETWCPFMVEYLAYLESLDFDSVILLLKKYADDYRQRYGLPHVDVVLLVHEAKSCKCAERPVLQKWFSMHGIELEEWGKGS